MLVVGYTVQSLHGDAIRGQDKPEVQKHAVCWSESLECVHRWQAAEGDGFDIMILISNGAGA